MGAFDKFLSYMKISDEDDWEEDEDIYEEEPKPEKRPIAMKDDPDEGDRPVKKPVNKAVTMNRGGGKRIPSNGMEVVRIEPTSVEDGRKITDLLLQNKVVFLDLEGIDMNLAQRIIDFTSGATYAIDGTLQQMSKYNFVIAPPVVSVSGDFQNALSGGKASDTF